jgi:hypothetical protein
MVGVVRIAGIDDERIPLHVQTKCLLGYAGKVSNHFYFIADMVDFCHRFAG